MREFYEKLSEFIEGCSDKKNEIPILNFVLKELGEVPDEVVPFICEKTGIWDVTLRNTISYYPKYSKKKASNVIDIVYCTGRQCVEGCNSIIEQLKEVVPFNENGVSLDGKYRLSTKTCFAECAACPNIEIDGILYNKINFKKMKLALGI